MDRTPAPVRPEELLAHADWLRGLASSLVRGEADADDLVQDTYLAALRRPPLDDRPVRGWLTEVVRNAGRMRARTEGRRAAREAVVADRADEGAPSADVLLGRLTAQRRLAELVAELPEPLRGTLLLRYYEGLTAADIARLQAVPAGTVRWRLKTGLERLRLDLDRDAGGDRRRWGVMLLPLADRPSPWTGISKGAWAMSPIAKIISLIATLLAAGGAAAALGYVPGHHAPTDGASATSRTLAGTTTRAKRASSLAGAPRGLPDPSVEQDAAAVHGAFDGRVVNWSTGKGVSGAEIVFSLDGETSSVTTDEDGAFSFEPPRTGRFVLALVTAAEYLPFAPELGHSRFELNARPGARVHDLTVELVPAIDYTGTVLSPEGKPVAGATVTLLGAGQGERALSPIQDRFVSDERGDFHFHAPDEALLEARHPSFGAARGSMDSAALTSHKLIIRLPSQEAAKALAGEKISGRVVDPGGSPVPHVLVTAHPRRDSPDAHTPGAQAQTDGAGRFTLEGLDPGQYSVTAPHPGYATAMADSVAAGADDLVLALLHGTTLTGRVVAADGRAPLPSFTIQVARHEGAVKEVTVAARTIVDSEGRFTIADLEPGDYQVRATATGRAPSRPVDMSLPALPASAAPLEITLSRGAKLVGQLVETAGGAPIPGARVSIDAYFEGASAAAPVVINGLTDDQGKFEVAGIPPGVRSLTASAYAHHMRLLGGLDFDEGVTMGPLTIDLARTKDGEQPHMELVGVGAVLRAEGDGLRVEKLIAGGGGLEVGLAPGDVILAVDGTSVGALGFDDSIQHIRGPEGSTVRLTVRRADGSTADLMAPRRRIQT